MHSEQWYTRNSHGIAIYIPKAFEKMREAGILAAYILDYIEPFVQAGVTTLELDKLCHDEIIRHDAIPAPLNYKGFPKSICTSVNNVICHGIPSANCILQNGDIINIDVTVILDGWYGDTSRMFTVGAKIAPMARRLIDATYESLMAAIKIVKPGIKLCDIGAKIEEVITKYRYSIVRDFCGHGIGRIFHDEPQVLHYKSSEYNEIVLEAGMFFTIEPMINSGTHKSVMLADGWTAVTKDGGLSAQFEHTIGVRHDGYEIFTQSSKNNDI